MRTNFKKFFVVLFLFVISMVHAQFESNYGYFENDDEEPVRSFGMLEDTRGIFSSSTDTDPIYGPVDVINYSNDEGESEGVPIDDYILPMLVIGIGLGIYYRKQWVRS